MKNRILPLVLAVCMMAVLLPTPAHAATSVSEIEITTSVPAEGKPLPTDARVPDDAGCRVTKVEWTAAPTTASRWPVCPIP